MKREYFTTPEAAERLRVSTRTIYRYAESGRLAGIKPPGTGQWLFTDKAIKDFLHGDAKGAHVNRTKKAAKK